MTAMSPWDLSKPPKVWRTPDDQEQEIRREINRIQGMNGPWRVPLGAYDHSLILKHLLIDATGQQDRVLSDIECHRGRRGKLGPPFIDFDDFIYRKIKEDELERDQKRYELRDHEADRAYGRQLIELKQDERDTSAGRVSTAEAQRLRKGHDVRGSNPMLSAYENAMEQVGEAMRREFAEERKRAL